MKQQDEVRQHMAEPVRVQLPAALTPRQRDLALRYLRERRSFSAEERYEAMVAFDILHGATLVMGEMVKTFRTLYDEVVEQSFADAFIEHLLGAADVRSSSRTLSVQMGSQIIDALKERDIYSSTQPDTRFVLAYGLYWWNAFTRGYTFEVEVLRDLTDSGILFWAHDLRSRAQRLSPCDLIVLGSEGDIKTSVYFLHVGRGALRCDFYITQVFDEQGKPRRVVIMKPAFWARIDGETAQGELSQVAALLPHTVTFTHVDQPLIVADYDEWKAKVRARQQPQEAN
jgi:hypothetical protein